MRFFRCKLVGMDTKAATFDDGNYVEIIQKFGERTYVVHLTRKQFIKMAASLPGKPSKKKASNP